MWKNEVEGVGDFFKRGGKIVSPEKKKKKEKRTKKWEKGKIKKHSIHSYDGRRQSKKGNTRGAS